MVMTLILILCETWSEPDIEVAGYRSVVTGTSKQQKVVATQED